MVREAVFSMLGDIISGADVLDAFSGSGAMGLEALSRGAASVTFCDRDPRAAVVIRQNIQKLQPCHRKATKVLKLELPRQMGAIQNQSPFSLILLDPPYQDESIAKMLLNKLAPSALAEPGSVAVWEQAPESLKLLDAEALKPWNLTKTRVWGRKAAAIFELEAAD
jgi:16S rRNA (guanine966-N2)-methyltransferase